MEPSRSPAGNLPCASHFRPQRAMKALPYPHFEKRSRSDSFVSNACFHLGLDQAHPPPASLPRFKQLGAIPLGQTFLAPVPTYSTSLPPFPYPPHPGPMGPGEVSSSGSLE